MIAVLQRTTEASVSVDGNELSSIGKGLLILLGIENADTEADIAWLCRKIVNLRIFNDGSGIMNVNCRDINAEILVVSQFTLHASVKKGNRPSYIQAAKSDTAIPLYERFLFLMKQEYSGKVEAGEFGANMQVKLINDGPVTIIIDSKNKK